MTDILVLSELWYPQGGGAEVSTYLYARHMVEEGHKVCVVTNADVKSSNVKDGLDLVRLPFRVSQVNKLKLLIMSQFLCRKIAELARSFELVYVPGKFVFMVPFIRRVSPCSRIVVHFHDYQLVCPQASLYDFNSRKRCSNVWSLRHCLSCNVNYEATEHGLSMYSTMGVLSAGLWRICVNRLMEEIVDEADVFITVSSTQAKLLINNLQEKRKVFETKNITVYNPVKVLKFVPIETNSQATLGYLGGKRYLKGFEHALQIFKRARVHRQLKMLVPMKNVRACDKLTCDGVECLEWLNPNLMDSVFSRMFLVLFTSLCDEPLPYVPMEAQMRGRPFLAYCVGGVSEVLVEEGVTGSLVKPGDLDGMAYMVGEWLERLDKGGETLTMDISARSRDFFKKRNDDSYKSFIKLVD